MDNKIRVAIIGAGPAGLYAAAKLADEGYSVAVFNKDIKPGGMAEYGIYPEKHTLKNGLRKQFQRILSCNTVYYFGNIHVGQDREVSISSLLDWGFSAVLICCGAQGTKWLGIPGEDLEGVIHAKDLVFHYNHLPPYGKARMEIGKQVVIVGAGNVMADVTRYLLTLPQVEKIHICVRRGPAEVKFTQKELEYIISGYDIEALKQEITRVTPMMEALGQSPEKEVEQYLTAFGKTEKTERNPIIHMHFLVSPIEMQGDENGRVRLLKLEENTLVKKEQTISARGSGTFRFMEADTVIFAIGDKVEEDLGVPVKWNDYAHSEKPHYPISDISYEIEDPQTGEPSKGLFVAGWSREASSGLVGNAKKDGVNAAQAIALYLAGEPPEGGISIPELERKMAGQHNTVVRNTDLERLLEIEQQRTQENPLANGKFLTNEEMLQVMGLL